MMDTDTGSIIDMLALVIYIIYLILMRSRKPPRYAVYVDVIKITVTTISADFFIHLDRTRVDR